MYTTIVTQRIKYVYMMRHRKNNGWMDGWMGLYIDSYIQNVEL